MKFCMSHYTHKSIPVAKFEFGSSSSFGDMASQNFSRKKATSHQIRLFPPENEFNFKNMTSYVQNRSSRPKIDPHVNFSNFQAEEIFSFSKFLECLDEKRAAATP